MLCSSYDFETSCILVSSGIINEDGDDDDFKSICQLEGLGCSVADKNLVSF